MSTSRWRTTEHGSGRTCPGAARHQGRVGLPRAPERWPRTLLDGSALSVDQDPDGFPDTRRRFLRVDPGSENASNTPGPRLRLRGLNMKRATTDIERKRIWSALCESLPRLQCQGPLRPAWSVVRCALPFSATPMSWPHLSAGARGHGTICLSGLPRLQRRGPTEARSGRRRPSLGRKRNENPVTTATKGNKAGEVTAFGERITFLNLNNSWVVLRGPIR